jgi:hypothetical protein
LNCLYEFRCGDGADFFCWNRIRTIVNGWSPGSERMSFANGVKSLAGLMPSDVDAFLMTSDMIPTIFLRPSSLNLSAVELMSLSRLLVNRL